MLKDLLVQSKWRVFNISIAKKIGLHETLVLMELADAEQFFKDDKFFITYEKISNNTTLSEHQVRNAIKHLKELGIIETSMEGLPAKQYFRIVGIDVLSGVGLDPPKSEGLDPLKNGGSIYKEPIEKEHIKKDKQKKKSIESNHKKSKTQIAKDFYQKQMETLHENFSGKVAILYPEFVDFLFGKNDLEHELNGVLSMEDQITVSQFNKLLEVAKKFNRTIKDSVMGIENGGYYKKKKSFYLTLRKWLSNTKYTQ